MREIDRIRVVPESAACYTVAHQEKVITAPDQLTGEKL
jgi:hypothetical protein